MAVGAGYVAINREVIVELRVVQTANCPEGWEEFAKHAWPGNSEGCSCALRVGLFEYEAVLRVRLEGVRGGAASASSRKGAARCLPTPPSPSTSGGPARTSA